MKAAIPNEANPNDISPSKMMCITQYLLVMMSYTWSSVKKGLTANFILTKHSLLSVSCWVDFSRSTNAERASVTDKIKAGLETLLLFLSGLR